MAFVLDDETTVSAQDAFNSTRDQRAQQPQTNFQPVDVAGTQSPIAPSWVDTSYNQPNYDQPSPDLSATVGHGGAAGYDLNYGSQNNGDANNDGLNDQTGFANGVTGDPSSPTGYSYYGTPTYADGSQYFAPGAYGPQQPQEEAGYNLNFASPLGGTANDAPVRPYTGPTITDYQGDPNAVSYPGQASVDYYNSHYGGGSGGGFLDTLGNVAGDIGGGIANGAQWLYEHNPNASFGMSGGGNAYASPNNPTYEEGNTFLNTSLLPSSITENIPNPDYFPARSAAEFMTSPAGIITGGQGLVEAGARGALPLATRLGTNFLETTGAFGAGNAAMNAETAYGNTNLPGADIVGSPAVQQATNLAAGALAGIAMNKSGDILGERIPKAIDAYRKSPLASELGEAKIPGSDARFRLSGQDAETGTRPGTLLNPRGAEQLGENYTPKDVLGVANDLNRQVNSQANTLRSEGDLAYKQLGDTFKGADGNTYFKDIPASPAEVSAGRTNALAVRVLERPDEYNLTPVQRAAVDKITSIPEAVKNERNIFGVAPNELAMDEGQNYFHRVAIAPAVERPGQEAEIAALVNGGSTKNVKDMLTYGESRGGSSRLAIGKDKGRIIADPIDFVKRGGTYADPMVALDQNVAQGLSKAANAHIKSLLEPFAQTAADRVSPGLRAKVDGLRQSINSLKQTGVRLGDRQQAIIDDFVAGKTTDLNEVRDALDNVRVGANAVGKQGPNFGKDMAALRQTLADTKQQLKDILPDWRKEVQQSRNIPGDRAAVDSRLAPALIGSDFEKGVAKQIERFYGRTSTSDVTQTGLALAKARAINTALIPAKATMDASSLFNQQGRMLVMHPKEYVANVARSFRDIVNPDAYNKLMSSAAAKDAASKGLVLSGEAGQRNEFLFNNWFEHIPGVGKIAQGANKQFSAFNNRMRLTAFDDWTEAAAKAGKPLDAAGQESLAKALNRMTGISTTRAGDLEQLAEFAPNFLRSHFENIGKAFSDGGIEGQVARRYLGTTFGVGTAAIAGVAMAQGRDPSEVLSPFDVKSLRNGELRWNSNFGTIRVGGQDVQVYGPYTPLARLAAVATTGIIDSVNERDARPFLAALMQIPETKGSPVLKFGIDAVKGQDFYGNSPTDLSLSGLGNAAANMVLPISIANVITDKQQGMSWHDTILDSLLNAIGANSNPLTPTERLNQFAPNGDFYSLPPAEQRKIYAAHPDLEKAAIEGGSPQRQQAYSVTQDVTNRQQQSDTRLASGAITPQQWRDDYHTRVQEISDKKDVIYANAGSKPGGDPVLDGYFKAIDGAKYADGTIDWDKVDAYVGQLPQQQQQYIDANTGLSLQTDQTKEYKTAIQQAGQTGYFDLKEKAWEALKQQYPDKIGNLGTFDEYKKAEIADLRQKYIAQGDDTKLASQKASDEFSGYKTNSVVNEFYRTEYRHQWVKDNPDLARELWGWGIFNPDAAETKYLNSPESRK